MTTLEEATTEELAEALRSRLSPEGVEAVKRVVGYGLGIKNAGLTDLEEARQLVTEQFAPMFEASRLASASTANSASAIVETLGRLTKAVEAQTAQMESSTFDVVSELKFIGTQLVNMYERHFDTAR